MFYQAAAELTGDILQEVPAYSSVKRGGQTLHRLARQGKPHSGISRKVRVRSIHLVGFHTDRIRFVVDCGSGTYVRMLCRDIGRKLGCGGVMAFLLRLRVGSFCLADSVTLEEIDLAPSAYLQPKELALGRECKLTAGPTEAALLRNGQAVWLPHPDRSGTAADAFMQKSNSAWAADGDDRLVALGTAQVGFGQYSGQIRLQPHKTFV